MLLQFRCFFNNGISWDVSCFFSRMPWGIALALGVIFKKDGECDRPLASKSNVCSEIFYQKKRHTLDGLWTTCAFQMTRFSSVICVHRYNEYCGICSTNRPSHTLNVGMQWIMYTLYHWLCSIANPVFPWLGIAQLDRTKFHMPSSFLCLSFWGARWCLLEARVWLGLNVRILYWRFEGRIHLQPCFSYYMWCLGGL